MEPATIPPVEAEDTGTKFFVFTVTDDLRIYTLVGEQKARDRDHALTKHFGKAPPLSVAISEHAFAVKKPKVVPVVQGLVTVEMPDMNGPPIVDEPPVIEPSEVEDDE